MEPTCDQPGKTIGSHCAVCQAVLTAQQEVPATGHRMIKHPAIASTCSVAGKTEWEECEICGYCPAPPQAVAKLPHQEVFEPGRGTDLRKLRLDRRFVLLGLRA